MLSKFSIKIIFFVQIYKENKFCPLEGGGGGANCVIEKI